MKELNKKQRKELLGKSKWSFFDPKILYKKLYYGGGVEQLDEQIKQDDVTELKIPVMLEPHQKGIKIEMISPLAGISFTSGLTYNAIKEIAMEDQEELYQTSSKSVVGRAVVGGAFLGPLGAIVGGMSGVGDKKKRIKMPDLAVTFVYEEEGKEKFLTCFCKENNKKEVIEYLSKHLGSYFRVNS